jgi:hypothetical protein
MARLITTLILIAVVIGIVLAVSGVLRFQSTNDESTITLDKKELRDKAHEAVEKTGETLQKAGERLRGSSQEHVTPTPTPTAPPTRSPMPDEHRTARLPDRNSAFPTE